MKQILTFIKKYPFVFAGLVVGVIALPLYFTGSPTLVRYGVSLFCLIVAGKVGWDMVQELKEGHYGVDILAFLAIISTVIAGEFWASLVIVLMLTGGEALEDFAQGRAQQELTALLARTPQVAHKKNVDGKILDVAIEKIIVGDELLVKPGEIVPVDGTLLDAFAVFDESSITGESLPVEHRETETIMSGVINGEQAVYIRALHTAPNSQYQKIVDLVKSAAASEAPFVRLADRYAVPFTIIALIIAGVAWAVTGEALRFVEVLVVATPCPLLLGAPIALISGMSRSAREGIIVKNGATLEKLAKIQTVAFDKTGTLTEGHPEVKNVFPENVSITETELVRLAASAEQQSAHILAQALVSESKKRNIVLETPSKLQEVTAQGIEATIGTQTILVGKFAFLHSQNITVKEHQQLPGETAIYVSSNGAFIGSITFVDAIRNNTKQTLLDLVRLGVKNVLMLTGDSKATAERIGASLNIKDVRAECLPEDKVLAVKNIQERPVLMVGDGVNDAPVLAVADVGMAMGARGATAASETADVVILVDNIAKVAEGVAIAKNTLKIALQSIITGIAISVVLMIVAAMGVIPPVIGAALQEVVDVIVIINALRAHARGKLVANDNS